MFTGLVERIGIINEVAGNDVTGGGNARRLIVGVEDDEYLRDAAIGESISVNGVCLTVVELASRGFTVQAVEETVRRTTLGLLEAGTRVNLERALPVAARLGGHIVQGHVDAVGTITGARPEGEGWWVSIEPPLDLMRYFVEKGSVCIDGISLTVANVAYHRFSVALIPHTRTVTTAGDWQEGTQVNLEVDIIAKYVERLTQWAVGPSVQVTEIRL
jgi:riboflavin synthase